jgi:hypothetical protein
VVVVGGGGGGEGRRGGRGRAGGLASTQVLSSQWPWAAFFLLQQNHNWVFAKAAADGTTGCVDC